MQRQCFAPAQVYCSCIQCAAGHFSFPRPLAVLGCCAGIQGSLAQFVTLIQAPGLISPFVDLACLGALSQSQLPEHVIFFCLRSHPMPIGLQWSAVLQAIRGLPRAAGQRLCAGGLGHGLRAHEDPGGPQGFVGALGTSATGGSTGTSETGETAPFRFVLSLGQRARVRSPGSGVSIRIAVAMRAREFAVLSIKPNVGGNAALKRHSRKGRLVALISGLSA